MFQGDIWDLVPTEPIQFQAANDDWRPEAPPVLHADDKEIVVNFETTGLRWFGGDLPVAVSVYSPLQNRSWYLPFGHAGHGNLSEDQVYRFCQEQLKGRRILNINTRFDAHMGRAWGEKHGSGGLNFEEMGCQLSDVAHYAALLDDHRKRMNLDSLIFDYLGEKPMVRLDESRMRAHSAGAAQARARYNVEKVWQLRNFFWPKLDREGLQEVRQLEDEVIFVVLEMEKNGTRINQEKLHLWIKQSRTEYNREVMNLLKLSGLKVNPRSSPDCAKLFRHLNIPVTEYTETGGPSFSDDFLKSIPHSTIKLLRRCRKLASINGKLEKYAKAISSDGILRYALHQLRAAKSEGEGAGETGTVTGRFTSTEIVDGEGINIQQVMKPEKQFHSFGDEYFIRELHEPPPGMLWASSDAEQIQYRLFAHEANNPKINKLYEENPWASFHRMVHGMLIPHKQDLTYGKCKDVNFAKMFAAGPTKMALMMGFISKAKYEELKAMKVNRYHPDLAQVAEILKVYDKEMPEVNTLLKKAEALAKERGYIRTIMGRRMRFPNGWRLHKALNGRIQGSEADIVKTKAVELHKNRKAIGFQLCFQVHDEFDGNVYDQEAAKRTQDLLNRQSFPQLRIPILWGMKTGTSWGDCSRDELEKLRKAHG